MPTIPSEFPAKATPRVDFRPALFRKMILTHGLDVTWEMSAECPCDMRNTALGMTLTDIAGGVQKGGTGQPRPDCPTCAGSGYRYHSSQPIKGLVLGAVRDPDRKGGGEIDTGMIRLSVLPEHRMSLGDRITMTDDPDNADTSATVHLYRETHYYDGEAVSTPRYPVLQRALKTDPAQTWGVMDIYVTDADGIAQAGGERVEGVDFTVTDAGAIAWVTAPAIGGRWSISYYAAPVYVVTDALHPHRDTRVGIKRPVPLFESLPLQYTCTLEYLTTGVVTRG